MKSLFQWVIGLLLLTAIIPIDYFHPFDYITGNVLVFATMISGIIVLGRKL